MRKMRNLYSLLIPPFVLVALTLFAAAQAPNAMESKSDAGALMGGPIAESGSDGTNEKPAAGSTASSRSVSGTVRANPNTEETTTAGINEALKSFGAAPACGTVILPVGAFDVSTTVGGSSIADRHGCVIKGEGGMSGDSRSGTFLKWAGTSGGTVVDLQNCYYCHLNSFTVEGNDLAGIGVAVSAQTGRAQLSFANVISDIEVRDLTQSPGIAFYANSPPGLMVDQTTFTHVMTMNVGTCFALSGVNTTNTVVNGNTSCIANQYGFRASGLGIHITDTEFAGGGMTIFELQNRASVLCARCYSEVFNTLLDAPGTLNVLGGGVAFENSYFSQPAGKSTTFANFTQNAGLNIESTGLSSNTPGATLSFAPVGSSTDGTIGVIRLIGSSFRGTLTFRNDSVAGNGQVIARDYGPSGPRGGMSWWPQMPALGSIVYDIRSRPILNLSYDAMTDSKMKNIYKWYPATIGPVEQFDWYEDSIDLGGWNTQGSPKSGYFGAYRFVLYGGGLESSAGHTLIPNGLQGYHGSTSGYVQGSDNSGALGNLPLYVSNGDLTDSGIPSAAIPQRVIACGSTESCSNATQTHPRIVWGRITLSSGTAQVTGMKAWTSPTSFACTGTDSTNAEPVRIENSSASSILITGSKSDLIAYQCIGD
jgi:hypothetical protein